MAYREVGMFEVKEILRLSLDGMAKKTISLMVGADIKTVRRYLEAAKCVDLKPPLDDGKLADVFVFLKSTQERELGEAYRTCQKHRDALKGWLDDGVRLTKARKLLKRHHEVPYRTCIVSRWPSWGLAAVASARCASSTEILAMSWRWTRGGW